MTRNNENPGQSIGNSRRVPIGIGAGTVVVVFIALVMVARASLT